jgi:hypothetical protein
LVSQPGFPRSLADAQDFADHFMAFYRDHFGLRNTLIHELAVLGPRSFDISDHTSAFVGKDGWLFHRAPGDLNLMGFRGLSPLTPEQLDAWQKALEGINTYLTEKKIPYLVFICPEKQDIYPEFMPDGLPVPGSRSHLDDLIDRLQKTHSPVHIIDIRPQLLEAKTHERLFKKTDTHWNDLGAYVAYCALTKQIAAALPGRNIVAHTRAEFDLRTSTGESGDLARILSLSSSYAEENLQLIPRFPVHEFEPTEIEDHRTTFADDPNLPRLLMFQDSFATALKPMFAPHFSQAQYFRRTFDPQLVLTGHPDIVISEFTERALNKMPFQPGANSP